MKILVIKQNKEIEFNFIEESGIDSIIDFMNFDYDKEKEIHTIDSYKEVEELLKYLILEYIEIEQEKELYLCKVDNLNKIYIGDKRIECSCDEKIIYKVIRYAKAVIDDLLVYIKMPDGCLEKWYEEMKKRI